MKCCVLIFAGGMLVGCTGASDPEYLVSIEDWRTERLTSLKADDGYLVLAGLYWLKQGENTYGSLETNDIVFPSGPENIGSFFVDGDSVYTVINNEVNVEIGNESIDTVGLHPLGGEGRIILERGPLSWYVILRGDQLGIRLKDLDHEVRSKFTDIEYFPVSQKWELKATFTPYSPAKMIPILNIVGYTIETPSEGFLSFVVNGEDYTIDVLPGGEDTYFVIFGDQTNSDLTYGAGRYMYIPKADDEGTTILDFNKAYNPPCAFTEFATCPLPPSQNRLAIGIMAGEKWQQETFQ